MHIRATVETDAGRESIKKIEEGHYEVAVKEPAENNRANHRVRELLAAELGVPLYRVHLMRGHRHSSKLFLISVTIPGKDS